MPDPFDSKLRAVIQTAADRIGKFRDRGLGEQNTKASLIEPLLEALGWDIRDPDEVHREFRPTTKDSPVDYALKFLRKPRLFIEAKGLREDLTDRKWVTQVLGYAIVAGVEWCLLTDGDEYRFYNATAPVDADEKLFCRFRLTDPTIDNTVQRLGLISRANLEENLLDVLWSVQFVDRRVREALQSMIGGADRGLIRLIRRKAPKLTSREVAESLGRLDFRIEPPAALPRPRATVDTVPVKTTTSPARKACEGRRASFDVKLSELISAGMLSAPLRLFRKYKGRELEATLLPDGAVEFNEERFSTCSRAAEAARKVVTGRRMNTNGWSFWQYSDSSGSRRELEFARASYLKRRPVAK